MATRLTLNRAATQTRQRIVRKIQRMLRFESHKHSQGYCDFAEELLAFIQSMDERQDKRTGGLGRKRK